MKKRILPVLLLLAFSALMAACGKTEVVSGNTKDETINLDITVEQVVEANHYLNLMKNHESMFFSTNIYTADDHEFLGYDSIIVENADNGIRMITTGANQSVGATQEIVKKEDGTWVKRIQSGGELEIEEQAYADEAAAMAELASFEKMDRSNVESEEIKSIDGASGIIVMVTEKNIKDEKKTQELTYQLDAESLEILTIHEVISTDSTYGDLSYETNYGYDSEPEFDITFFDDSFTSSDEIFSSDEYVELTLLLDLMYQEASDSADIMISYCTNYTEIDAATMMKMTEQWIDEEMESAPDLVSKTLEVFDRTCSEVIEKNPSMENDSAYNELVTGVGTALRSK